MLIIKGQRKLVDDELDEFMWGCDNTAFIKSYLMDGQKKWIICSSDGAEIAEVDSREQAFVIARQNNLCPCSAH